MTLWHVVLVSWLGWGLSAAFWMVKWLPDPPPDGLAKFISVSIAGIVGGLVGGVIAYVASDPMPAAALVSALAGSLIVTGGWLAITLKGKMAR
jgi:hypothetical protein